MYRVSIVTIIASLCLASLAFGDTVVFNSPTGDLTTTHTYLLDGIPIVATAVNGGDLFGKNSGTHEIGLGLNGDPLHQDEIFVGTDFVQLDLSALIAAGFHSFSFEMNSSTKTDSWSVSACAVSGTDCGTSPVTGTDQVPNSHGTPINLSSADPFLDFSATSGNVLINSLSATSNVPEPRFYGALLLGGLSLAGLALRKRRATQA